LVESRTVFVVYHQLKTIAHTAAIAVIREVEIDERGIRKQLI